MCLFPSVNRWPSLQWRRTKGLALHQTRVVGRATEELYGTTGPHNSRHDEFIGGCIDISGGNDWKIELVIYIASIIQLCAGGTYIDSQSGITQELIPANSADALRCWQGDTCPTIEGDDIAGCSRCAADG